LYSLRVREAVEFRIYDIRGRLLRTLVNGYMPAGRHHVVWDGSTDDGRRVGSGVYLYTFRLANHETSGKIFRLR
jgi:flagellar hook assembly protein FlgD